MKSEKRNTESTEGHRVSQRTTGMRNFREAEMANYVLILFGNGPVQPKPLLVISSQHISSVVVEILRLNRHRDARVRVIQLI